MRSEVVEVGGRRLETRRAELARDERRLQESAAWLARAAHPGVVEVAGSVAGADGLASLTTTRPDGPDLAELGPLPTDHAAGVGAALATTVADLHDIGVVHGDLQADRVVVDRAGRPVLLDPVQPAGAGPDGDVKQLVALVGALFREPPRRLTRVLARAGGRRATTARALAADLLDCVPGAALPAWRPPAPAGVAAGEGPAGTPPALDGVVPVDVAEGAGAGEGLAERLPAGDRAAPLEPLAATVGDEGRSTPEPDRSGPPVRPGGRRQGRLAALFVGALVVGVVAVRLTSSGAGAHAGPPARSVGSSSSTAGRVTSPSRSGSAPRRSSGPSATTPGSASPGSTASGSTSPGSTSPGSAGAGPGSGTSGSAVSGSTGAGSGSGASAGVGCPPADAGCGPLRLVDDRFHADGTTMATGVGAATVVLGRWWCSAALPVVLDRRTGQVWAWTRWPGRRPVVAKAVGIVPGAVSLRTLADPGGCDVLRVLRRSGPPVALAVGALSHG